MNKHNKYLKKLYLAVKRNVDELDCYHLLRDGAPPDEFDIEIKDLCRRISPENTSYEIAQIIADVFEEWMDAKYSVNSLMEIAKDIKNSAQS